jgi:hypothetical protein
VSPKKRTKQKTTVNYPEDDIIVDIGEGSKKIGELSITEMRNYLSNIMPGAMGINKLPKSDLKGWISMRHSQGFI